jgi:hypothetical protein
MARCWKNNVNANSNVSYNKALTSRYFSCTKLSTEHILLTFFIAFCMAIPYSLQETGSDLHSDIELSNLSDDQQNTINLIYENMSNPSSTGIRKPGMVRVTQHTRHIENPDLGHAQAADTSSSNPHASLAKPLRARSSNREEVTQENKPRSESYAKVANPEVHSHAAQSKPPSLLGKKAKKPTSASSDYPALSSKSSEQTSTHRKPSKETESSSHQTSEGSEDKTDKAEATTTERQHTSKKRPSHFGRSLAHPSAKQRRSTEDTSTSRHQSKLHPADRELFREYKEYAYWLDGRRFFCGLLRFGICHLLTFIPLVGGFAGFVLSALFIEQMRRQWRLPLDISFQMYRRLALFAILSFVPFIGPLLSMSQYANVANVKTLKHYLEEEHSKGMRDIALQTEKTPQHEEEADNEEEEDDDNETWHKPVDLQPLPLGQRAKGSTLAPL